MANQLNNPSQWTTGNDPPTDKQKAFLHTLSDSKAPGESINPDDMNKSEVSSKIDELKNKPAATSTTDQGTTGPQQQTPKGPDGSSKEGTLIEDPSQWATGDDQATGKQMGYIAAMAKNAGEQVPQGGMGKAEASQKIGNLKEKTGM
ncbi:MAG: hypothetical protein MMC23_006598 [Stictis urceolatum]|nr:hypothetical protein [Stictis urceolata]